MLAAWRWRRVLPLFLVLALVTTVAAAAAENATAATTAAPLSSKALLFASDGMRPDLMERYAAAGAMPTYAGLMRAGLRGQNGLRQGFPPNTGVGWVHPGDRHLAG